MRDEFHLDNATLKMRFDLRNEGKEREIVDAAIEPDANGEKS